MLEQTADDPRAVKSAFRALEILQLMTQAGRALSFSDCQQALGYPKGSLHALLRTMVASRWITHDEFTKRYALGVRVWEAGIACSRMWPLELLAKPIMLRVRDATSETAQLAVLDDFQVLYIAKIDGAHLLRLESCVGLRMQPHATGGGKILLSGLADEELRMWLSRHVLQKYTPNTITDPTKFLEEIERIRLLGYAIDREEILPGATCVAVGIRNHQGSIVAALSIAGATVRLRKKEQDCALKHLRSAAAELSAALGYSTAPAAASLR